MDSTVYIGGGPIDAEVYRQLQQQFPDCLFIPENENTMSFESSTPYGQANMNVFFANSATTQIYPKAFALIESHGLTLSNTNKYAMVVNSIHAGNIWTVDGWFNSAYDNTILQTYRDAAANPTPTR